MAESKILRHSRYVTSGMPPGACAPEAPNSSSGREIPAVHASPDGGETKRGAALLQTPRATQNPTSEAPFKSSIDRASAGVAICMPNSSTMCLIFATC